MISINYNNNNNNKRPQIINSYDKVTRTVPYKHNYRKRPSRFKIYTSRFLLMIAFAAVISGATAAVFFTNLTRIRPPLDFYYSIEWNEQNDRNGGGAAAVRTTSLRIPHEIGFANNILYFPLNDLMRFMNFFPAGDGNARSFVRSSPSEHIRF